MNSNKVLIGGLVGGVAFFLLGWLIYGLILMDYMQSHSNTAINRPMEEMIWWALILAQLGWGFLLALILEWAGARNAVSGAKIGAVIGFISSLSLNLGFYSMTTMYADFSPILVDVAASTIMWTIAGALVGMVLRRA